MIVESIALIIFVVSLGGVLIMLEKKMPALSSLPQNGTTGIKKHKIILDIENKFKDFILFFKNQIFFHKLLSWIKVITLKIETRVDHLLHKIRKKAQKK